MFESDIELKKDLCAHHVYTAWQFIQYTQKNIDIVEYCASTIQKIIEKMSQKTIRWQRDLFEDFTEEEIIDGKRVRRTRITTANMPAYELRVAGEKIDPWFLFDKLLRDFYQYTMNSFDSMSQVANSGLLANKSKKVDSVDFQKMNSCFALATYSTAFPKTSYWFKKVFESSEFKYIEAINNRTKHTADIANKLSMGILGGSNTTKIGPFFRKEVQHDKQELSDQLQATLDFLRNSWDDFLTAFCDEYILDTYTDNRTHKIGGVYQQKMKDDSTQDLSYAYIPVVNDFNSMPNEIRILLLSETDDDIEARCSPFDTILVRDTDDKTILGQYVSEDTVGEDCLFHYRKYVKDVSTCGVACIHNVRQSPTHFYHNNRFFTVTAVSDDDYFLARSSLPF